GAVRTAPDILAHAAVEFVLGALALRHASYSNLLSPPLLAALQPGIAPAGLKTCRGRRFTGVRGQSRAAPLDGQPRKVNRGYALTVRPCHRRPRHPRERPVSGLPAPGWRRVRSGRRPAGSTSPVRPIPAESCRC